MDPATLIILFVFGLAIGSFLNVVATRYDGEHFLFGAKLIGGRSHCEHCKKTLRWFELVPLVNFVAQGGRCRSCKTRLSVQYPVVELISGLIFVFVPLAVGVDGLIASAIAAALWIAIFEALLVMSLVDIRLGIIPDEISIFLGAIGVVLMLIPLALFGGQGSGIALAQILGAAVAGIFFALLIAVTRGKGMGMGDLKLAIPLGLIFGWPDIVLVLMLSYVIGAIAGLFAIAHGKNTMKGTLPFGPFLALGGAIVFFWGSQIIGWYLSLLK